MNELEETEEDLRTRRDRSFDGWIYGNNRLDTLIISISGGGVYICLDALKDLSKINTLVMIKVAGTLFAIAIITNIISQVTGSQSNLHCYNFNKEKLKNGLTEKAQDFKKQGDQYDTWTKWLNSATLLVMLSALLSLIAYFLITF